MVARANRQTDGRRSVDPCEFAFCYCETLISSILRCAFVSFFRERNHIRDVDSTVSFKYFICFCRLSGIFRLLPNR